MKDRIKEIRKALDISQDSFAEQLNLSRNFVWMLEKGEREASDRTIQDICRIFGINESWLRTGEGEMKAPISREQEIANITAQIIKDNNPIRIQLERIVCNLTDEQLEHIYQMAKELVESVEKDNLPD